MPAVSNLKYQQIIGDYTFTFWFGEEFDFSTPSTVTLNEDIIKDFEFSGETDSPFGLHSANNLKLTLDVSVFNSTEREAFINGTITNTQGVDVFTIGSGSFAGTYGIDDFTYLNTIQVDKDGVTIFLGVQEIQDETDLDGDFLNLEFTCLITKALQILPLKTSETIGGFSRDWILMLLFFNTGTAYNNSISHYWSVDNYYTDGGSVRGVIIRDDQFRETGTNQYSMTFKYLWEILSGWVGTLISKYMRTTETFTFNNPLAYIKFYKLSALNDFLKTTQLTDDEIRFFFFANGISQFGKDSLLNYDSWWEFLKVFTESLFIRSKVDYDNLQIVHYPILDDTDEVLFDEEVKIEGSVTLYKWKWNEINNTINNTNRVTFEREQAFPNDEILLTKKGSGSGNLKRVELRTHFHNVPVTSSNHRYRKLWLASDNNLGAIGYNTTFSIDSVSRNVFVRSHDVVSIRLDSATYYEPTNPVNTTSLPDANDRSVSPSGAKVANDYYNWRALRLRTTTLPTEINHLIWNFLRGGSVTFEFTTDQDIDINSINSFCSFSDYTFLPNYLQSFNTKGVISKITKNNGFAKVEVTIAN